MIQSLVEFLCPLKPQAIIVVRVDGTVVLIGPSLCGDLNRGQNNAKESKAVTCMTSGIMLLVFASLIYHISTTKSPEGRWMKSKF